MQTLPLHTVPVSVDEVPARMQAVVIREERQGAPLAAMQTEEVPVPDLGSFDVLVLVMAAGINFNGVWAAQGKPGSVFRDLPFHIPGSDAAGIVWRVGERVRRWKPGDEVIVHPNQSCGECAACNGRDPVACAEQKTWGYDTVWGAFAQFTKVQARQLLPRPRQLSWIESASYGLTCSAAYQMLVGRSRVKAGDYVLIWGAAGGLGLFAVQICRLLGAHPIAVVSSSEKVELLRSLGAESFINRTEFDFAWRPDEDSAQTKRRLAETRRLGAELRRVTGGRDPDVVLDHVGAEILPASLSLCGAYGKVILGGAISGSRFDLDAQELWTQQKEILGSHGANAYQAECANELVISGKIKPVVDRVFDLAEVPKAHQLMLENRHKGKLGVSIQAPRP
jgi:crotonyl-CoA carboxylase/reductase